jgi:hypothetical protein
MASIAEVAPAIERILSTVADQMARTSHFVQRKSKLTGAVFVQTLVLSWLHKPRASLAELSQTAAQLGVAITPQGLAERFTDRASILLEEVVNAAVTEVIAADPVAIPILRRFSAVTVQDSSTLTLPPELAGIWRGCGGSGPEGEAALKIQVRYDLLSGRLEGPLLEDGRAADPRTPLQTRPQASGTLRLQDLGYFRLELLADLSAQGIFWLSRLLVNTTVRSPDGQPLDLPQTLPRIPEAIFDQPVQLGVEQRLPARLLAVRVPQAVADQRRRKLRTDARRHGRTVSLARRRLADWTILVTNVPPDRLTVPEALVLYRARWQVELLFKLWKQHGLLDTSTSAQPWRVLCELYAKLLAVLIQHWICLTGCWAFPDRSLVKAAQAVRSSAVLLAAALTGAFPLSFALAQIQRRLAAPGCRLNPRKTAPNTSQLLLAFPDEVLT